jgi:hypothetical protein
MIQTAIAKILAQHYNFVYGRVDIFTKKIKDTPRKFAWYINEVQNHGIEPEIIYPDILNTEEEKELKSFRSIIPIRYNPSDKDVKIDINELPNVISFAYELEKLMPDSAGKINVMSLIPKQNELFRKIMKEFLHYKLEQSDDKKLILFKTIEKLLENHVASEL